MENNREDTHQSIHGLPRIGDPAPAFEAVSTKGIISLGDYEGKWLILFSHPADFTPVCTTEFIAFSEIQDALRELNCELLGLSIDSLFSHIAWVRNIKERFGKSIEFPIIADLSKEITYKYGMIMPHESNTDPVRCVFIIDVEQIIRAIIYYPMTTGRSTEEILRLVKALQTANRYGVGTGANWNPGDKVIDYPPLTQEMAEERVSAESRNCKDWYFCEKELEEISSET